MQNALNLKKVTSVITAVMYLCWSWSSLFLCFLSF